ncbi:type 4 prepilin peptidase [Streptococcus pneumoniae]|nr:type 4 prepilin peptidase [Streptococcus pneumoniae]
MGQVVLITAGLTLGIYDFHHQEYPLLVWMTFHLILIASSGWNLVMVSFLALGILAHFIDIRMGAGDFLFLASCALVFSVTELLILIQFASATGILAFLLQKKKEIPCTHADIDKMSQNSKSKEGDHDQIPARGSY